MLRPFVVCAPETDDVIGFYSLANGAVRRAAAVKRLQRDAPDPIPVMVLGRRAGIAAIPVHAKSLEAAGF